MDKQKKTAIILVSFGTTEPAAKERALDALERDACTAFPDALILHAYTSPTVRRILRQRGEAVLSLEEALEQAKAQRVRRVVCRCSYLLEGHEYDAMVAAIRANRPFFDDIIYGRSLLRLEGGAPLLNYLREYIPCAQNQACLLVGHGTTHEENRAYAELEARLENCGAGIVRIVTIERTEDPQMLVRALREGNVRQITLIPLLSVAGVHAKEDIFGETNSWYSLLRDSGFTVVKQERGLCEAPQIRRSLIRSIERSLLDA